MTTSQDTRRDAETAVQALMALAELLTRVSTHRAVRSECGNFCHAVTQFLQHHVGVLPEHRCRPRLSLFRKTETNRSSHTARHFGIISCDDDAGVHRLFVVDEIINAVDGRDGCSNGCQVFTPVWPVMQRKCSIKLGDEFCRVAQTERSGQEPWIGIQLTSFDGGAESRPPLFFL